MRKSGYRQSRGERHIEGKGAYKTKAHTPLSSSEFSLPFIGVWDHREDPIQVDGMGGGRGGKVALKLRHAINPCSRTISLQWSLKLKVYTRRFLLIPVRH